MKKYILWFLKNFEEFFACAGLAVTLIITTANVLIRYIFRSSIPGYSDICVFGFAWSVFLGMSACYKRGMHYGVDLLMVILPKKGKNVLRIIIDIILFGGCCVALYLAWNLFSATLLGTGRVSSYLHLSYGYMYMSGVIGFGLMVFHSIRNIITDVRTLFGKGKEAQTC